MANGNSTLPPIQPGDPSDIQKRIESLRTPTTAPTGKIKLERAPGNQFQNTPFSPILDAPKIIGSQGWLLDITNPTTETLVTEPGVARNIALTGVNVADPRVVGDQSKFQNENMKLWETSGDKWRNAVFGGAAQGINRLGEDFGALLGGSLWGEDFERSAIERYFAGSSATYQEMAKIYDEDSRFYQGVQGAIASFVEFGPLGGAVVKGTQAAVRQIPKITKAVKGSRVTKASFDANGLTQTIGATTRVSEQVAANGSKLSNWFIRNQNALAQVGTAVPAGIIQNRFEGTAMALQTRQEILEKLSPAVEKGDLTYEEAERIANQEANGVRAMNNAMMIQDIFQHALLFRGRGITRTGYQRPGFTWNPKQYLINSFGSTKGAFNYATSNFIVQGVGEALEEGFQSGIQQEAIRNAQLSARGILEETGKDKTTIQVDNLVTASKSNVLDRYLGYLSSDDTQFEMAIGFFAGAGQRMVQSYTNQVFDSHKYNTYSKKIEALKRDLPTDTPENRQYRQQKIQELEYKRALETEKGRSEAAKTLLQTLKTDVSNSVKFAMDTDDLIEAAEQNGLEWVAEGIKSKAFYQLFMKHAGNGTVDHLERHLQDIAEGRITSKMFPENGDAKGKAKELLTELTRLEKDFLSLQGYRGAHKILNAQENARIDQKIVDDAFAKRESNKQSIIDDLRKISKSKATEIELDLETGQVVMKNSLGKEIKLSKAMAKAIESSNAYQEIFAEGGLNDQIDALQEKVINTRAEMSEMISKSGQARLQREEEVLEDEIRKRQKLAKTGRKSKGGKTKSDRDRNNVDNSKNRANSGQSSQVEGDTITGSSVLTPESNPESAPKDTESAVDDPLASQDAISALEQLMGLSNIPSTPKGKATSNDIKSDEEVQDAAEAAHIPNTEDNPVFGYDRGKTSNENKVASLQLEYEASVENGVITLTDTDLNKVDGYLALSDATRVQEGDTVEFRVLKGTEADSQKVRDVSDLDKTKQGKVKTVKEARANSKKLAEHESEVSDTTISEAQIEEDITPIQIILKRTETDGTVTETIIGYVHTPLYEREARRDNDDKTIAEDKKKLRDFRAQILAGKAKGGRISTIRPVRLNYISKAARRSTKAAFSGLTEGPQGNYIIAYADATGSLIVKGGSSIKSVNGLGRNANIVNLEDVQEGMAYAVVPLKKSQDGKVQYYAAPLFTRQVSVNNVEVMMTAIQGFIDKNTKLGGAFKSRLDTPDPSGLVRILKRFTRVRGTHNMLHKAGQSFIYTKTVPMPDGSTKDVIVFSKVLSEQEGGVEEVEIIQGKPLSNEDAAFVKQVLSEQYTNIDFDAVKEDKAFSTTIDADGNVKTIEGNITDYVAANTLASIEPVRTKDGKLPNGRVIFHVNPDVRFVSDVEGISSAPEPDVKPDEEPQAPTAPVSTDTKADIERRKQETIASIKEGYNGGKTWNYVGQFSNQVTEKTDYEVFQEEYTKEQLISEIEKRYNTELAALNQSTETTQPTTPDLDEELNAFNDSFEDEESGLLPQAATNRSDETRNRFNIKGLNPTQQEQLIGSFIGDLISEMSLMQVSDRLASPEQLFDEALDYAKSKIYSRLAALRTKVEKGLADQETEQLRDTLERINKLEAAIKEEESKLIELALTRFEQQSGVSKKSRRAPKPTEVDKSTDRSKKIADSILGLFTKNVSKESLAIDEDTEFDQDEESGEAAPGINKSYHSDNFYFTLDPIDTASSRLRQSLMTLTELNPDGSIKKNFLGGNVHGDPYQVFKLLSTALDGSKPEFASQIETLIRKYLTDRGFRNAAPWLPSLVLNSATVESLQANELGKKFLEKAFPNSETRAEQVKRVSNLELNPQILNEFASVMAKHSLVAPMISMYTTSEGVVYANVFSQNRNSTTSIVKEEFEKGMKNRLYTYDAASGNYIINEEAFTGAIAFLDELYTSEGKISQSEFRLLMNSKLGIDLSEESVKSLFEDGIKLETSKTSRRVKMTDSAMWGNRSPFNIMKAHLNEILTKKVPYTTKRPTNFGAIDRLVKVEATRSTSKRYGTTFYSGGRNIATMTSNKYFSNLLDELFTEVADRNNPEYVEKLVNETHQIFKSVFESPSQLLEAIYSGAVTREDLEVQYLNFSPLKQGSESSEDFNKLQKEEHTIVKNSLFTASVNTQRKFTTASGFIFEQRQATIVPLTFSDKDTVMALKTLVPVMDFDATGQISNKTVSLFYDHVLMSEINRIIAFSSNNANSGVDEASSESGVNNRELEEASGLFFLFPQLNNFVIQYRGEQMLLREALELYPSEAEMAEIKPNLEKELRGILLEMVDDKLQEFQENPDLYTAIPQPYKDFLREKHPRISDEAMMRMVAADITLGQTLGTSNVIQMFVGDPALYAKVSKNSDGTIDVNTTIKATYANIDKRLAALIAPGIEPSRESDNEEYIQIMVPDIKMDYDSALFEGLPDEFIKAFKGVEATDAQEFITYEEYLDNAVRFGEITKATADKIISLIQKESKGYVMTTEDKDLLKSVMFKAQKPVGVADHYTTLKGSKQTVRQRVYIKTSAVPLLPFFTRGTQLDNLRQAMERLQKDKGVGVRLTFKTGTKVGFPAASKTSNIVNKDGSIKTIDELYSMFRDGNEDGKPYVTIKRKYWRIQQSVPTKTKDETTRGTQPDALIGSGISVAPEIEPIVNKFNSNSEKLFRLRADELRKELMVDNPNTREGGKIIDKEKLAILLEEVAKDRGFDFNVIEGLTIGEDGQFEIPAELSAASEQFQSMLMSIARKGIARKKVTGGSQVLMSEAMFRYQQGVQGTSDILYTNAYDEATGLKPMRMEDGVVKPAQIIIPNRFQLPNGKTINFRKYIDDSGRIDLSKLPEGALEGFGFRIPTQGYNSMAVVEVVGFLPDYMGDLVIAPRSFMVQMGSDFDVDKLYDYFFKFEEKGGQLSKVQNDTTEYGLQNALLQNRIDILKNPKIFRLIKTPLDFGLHKFKPGASKYTNSYDAKLSEEINRAGGVAEAIAERQQETSKTKTSIVSEFYQRSKYLEARAALDAVGVKASLNSFSAILTSTSKSIELVNPITFGKDIQVKTIVGAQTLKGSGRLKQDVISGSLSAAVDNQNEQIVNKYNLNEHTFDAHDAMELMGFEEDFSQAFLEQDIIKFIVSEVQAGAYYNVKAAILDLKLKLLTSIYKANNPNAVEIDSKALSDLATQIELNFNNSTKDYSYDQVVSMLWENMNSEEIDLEYSYNILDKFQSFSGIMSDLRPVIRLVSSDAKGAGSSITDFVALAERADEILEDDYVTSKSMLGILGETVIVAQTNYPKIRSLEAKGYIKGPSTSQGYIMVKPDSAKAAGSLHTFALSQDLIMSEFSGVYDIIRNTSSKPFVRPTRDTKKIIEKAIRQYVNSNPQLFSDVDRSQLLYPSEGRPSLAQIIEVVKAAPQLRNNALIQELEVLTEENTHHTLTFRNSAADDLVTDKHAKAFLDLLLGPNSNRVIESVNMTPNQIGRALVDYAFLTGGVKSAVDFVRFVPTSYLIDLGFYTNLKSGFNGLKTDSALKTHFVQQLLQHNPDLVQIRVKLDKNEGVSFDSKFSNVAEGIVEFTPSAKFKERAGIAFEDNAFIVEPTYLYITVKPNNRPRRVLKFNSQTGRYEMLDNLGTGTISEYSFGDAASETILVENKVSNYLGVRKEEEEDFEEDTFVEDTFEEAAPAAPGTKAPKIAKDPAKAMAALMGFTESEPLQETVGDEKVQDGEVDDIVDDDDLPPLTPELINKWGTLLGEAPPSTVPTVKGTEVEPSSDSLAGFKSTLEANPASTVTLTEDGIESLLEEVAQSDDMAHKFLAREIIDSGVIKQKKPSITIRSGNILDSTATSKGTKLFIDGRTTNWDFEQTLLHELGHNLTIEAIDAYQKNPASVSPEVRKALAKLNAIRQQFFVNLLEADPAEIALFNAFTNANDGADVSQTKYEDFVKKVNELKEAGDLKGLQELFYKSYGATDLKEFVTMVMSSKTFRDMLDRHFKIDLSGKVDKSFLSEMMEVLMDLFRGVLNLEKRPISQYALEQTMVVMKNEPKVNKVADVSRQPMIVKINNTSYTVTPNNLVLDKGKKVTNAGVILKAEMKVAEKQNELGKVFLSDDNTTYYVFQGFDKIKVVKISPTGTITQINPSDAKYPRIIEEAFKGGDNIITGNETVTPTAPTTSGDKAYDALGNELELFGNEIMRSEDGSLYEEFDTAEEAQKAFNKLRGTQPAPAQPAQPQAAQQPVIVQSSPKRSIIEDTKFTYKGLNGENITVETGFRLTEGQGAALESLVDFVLNPKSSEDFADLSMTLEGPAGTGKTTVIGLVKKIVEQAGLGFLDNPTFIYAAPTHAATVALTAATVKFGETSFASTIQSLGGMRVDRRNPQKGPKPTVFKKLSEKSSITNLIVVDEASMLSKEDYEFLKKLSIITAQLDKSRNYNSYYRVIFMGDPMQIPEVDPTNPETKLVSAAFTDSPKVSLTEVKRTSDNDILELLEEMRANITGRIPVINDATNIKYRRKADGLRDFISKIKEDGGEDTVYIGYTNNSVSETNKFVRKSLGYEGGLKPGEVITGYLGYQSKQVVQSESSSPGLANSVRFTVESTEVDLNGGLYKLRIKSRSKKLADLAKAGVGGINENGEIKTTYIPLSPDDSIALEVKPTKEQYEKNNEEVSDKMRKLYTALQKALKDSRFWADYDEQKFKTQKYFAVVDLGDDYVYNPNTDRMEKYDSKNPVHKKAKKDSLLVEKGIDYGYAITIHKSQGSTIDNVFFDANTLPPKGPTIIDRQGNRITEEAHALAYVGASRASKSLTVIGDRADKFYTLGKDKAPIIGYEKRTKTPSTGSTQKRDLPPMPPGWENLYPSGIIPLQGTVEDFLKTLDTPERRVFAEMIKGGEIKTICKLA
jgi:hypothetical protein